MENEQIEERRPREQEEKEEAESHTSKQEERNKRCEMAYNAQTRETVPGLFLGNVKASYQREML